MKTDEMNPRRPKQPEDKVIFASLEEIKNIENVIDKLEITCRELQKVAKGMKPVEN